MPEQELKASTSRFAWMGTAKGAIALVASLISITGGTLGILKVVGVGQGIPSFEASVVSQDKARDFVSFLTDHDEETVKLNVSCGPLRESDKADSGCNGNVGPEYAPYVAGAGEQLVVMELFTKRACPADDDRSRCPGTYWVVFRVGSNDDEQVDNGPFGAGGLVAKGTFKALVRGAIGAAPRDVQVVELIATD